jgi:integrase
MPKPTKPDLERTTDGFHRTRLRYGKGLRGRFLITLHDEAAAEKRAVRMREMAEMLARAGHSARAPIVLEEAGKAPTEKDFSDAERIVHGLCAGKGEAKARKAESTFQALADRWTSGALAREYPDHVGKKKTADLDEARLEWICATTIAPGLTFGALPLSAVTLDHAQAVMANLPKTTKRPATRRQYAQLLHRVLELAVFPCRLLETNPLPKGFMPKTGKSPAFPYLYPAEEVALMGRTALPLGRRLLWGVLSREGCRTSEACALQLGLDVDLELGAVRLDKNKTDDARAWAMDPAVVRALQAYVKARGAGRGDYLFVDDAGQPFDTEKLAEQLRDDLMAAGVDRHELLHDGENTRKLRAHDLRGTFVTLGLANGKTETWISDRTGHGSSVMINRYRRSARTAAELGLGPLLPLDRAVPELAAPVPAPQGGPEGGPGILEAAPTDVTSIANAAPSLLVPKERLELSLPCGKRILSPPRLPVPPLRLDLDRRGGS